MNNNLYTSIAIALVGILAIGAYYFPGNASIAGAPNNGSTFNTSKVAAVNMAPVSASATSTSILNGDSNDRIVLDAFVTCTGITGAVYGNAGVATWNWQAATTATNAPANLTSLSLAAMNVTVATSSTVVISYSATSTYTSNYARIWNAGSYMTFTTNATSTGLTCQPGLHYLAQ